MSQPPQKQERLSHPKRGDGWGRKPAGSHPVPKGQEGGGGQRSSQISPLLRPPLSPPWPTPRTCRASRGGHRAGGVEDGRHQQLLPLEMDGLKPGAQRSAAHGPALSLHCATRRPPAGPLGDTATQTGTHLGTIGRCSAPGWPASVGVDGSVKEGDKCRERPKLHPDPHPPPPPTGTAASPARVLVPKREAVAPWGRCPARRLRDAGGFYINISLTTNGS